MSNNKREQLKELQYIHPWKTCLDVVFTWAQAHSNGFTSWLFVHYKVTVNCLSIFGIINFKTLEKLAKSWLSSKKQTIQAGDANKIKIHEIKMY